MIALAITTILSVSASWIMKGVGDVGVVLFARGFYIHHEGVEGETGQPDNQIDKPDYVVDVHYIIDSM